MKAGRSFAMDELGQSLSEYCMIVALVALIALGVVIKAAGGINAIWSSADNMMATPSSTTATPGSPTPASNHDGR